MDKLLLPDSTIRPILKVRMTQPERKCEEKANQMDGLLSLFSTHARVLRTNHMMRASILSRQVT